MDSRLHQPVAYVDRVQQLWKNIKKMCDVPNIPVIHKLNAQIASCKQNKQDVVDFFSRLMGLCTELDNSIKIPPCKCEMRQNDQVHGRRQSSLILNAPW